MLVRLWWKEWQSLAPTLVTLVVTATGVQWFLLSYGGSDIRNGILVPISLCWAVLYALAAGSASFAGERENRTLELLDALPVGRGTLWFGKTSFALVSSLALGVVLRMLGVTGWRYESISPSMIAVEAFFAILIAEATIWGLFWSALSKNAITAGILAVISTGVMLILTGWLQELDSSPYSWAGMDSSSLTWRLGGMTLALAVSWLVMSREHRPRHPFWSVPRYRTAAARQRAAIRRTRSRRDFGPTPAFCSVVWQTWREGRLAWLQTLAIGLIATLFRLTNGAAIISLTLLALALVIQGSSVFGVETAFGTRAFLDHQAIHPPTVWAGKIIPWMVGLVLFCGCVGYGLLDWGDQRHPDSGYSFVGQPYSLPLSFLILLLNMFAIALLGGMIFKRRITAAMVSIVVAVGVIIPQAAWFEARMISGMSLLYSPLIWLAVSLFWAGDWLASRGRRRWIKLAALVVVPYAALFAIYVTSRAWEIKDVGPQYGDASFMVAPPDLGNQYREVVSRSGELQESNQPNADPKKSPIPDEVPRYPANLQNTLADLRAIADQPGSVAAIDAPATIFVKPRTTNAQFALDVFVPLLTSDASDRAGREDLTGAWEDLESLLRMSDQYAKGARSIHDYKLALTMSHTGVAEAIEWSKRSGMTIDLIRSARSRLREVGETPDPGNALRYEARRVELSLDQPADRWAELFGPRMGFEASSPWLQVYMAWVVAPPWERERTRRIMRLVEETAVRNVSNSTSIIEPFRYSNEARQAYFVTSSYEHSFPTSGPIPRDVPLLGQLLEPFVDSYLIYHNELNHRRLLDLFLRLRAWQITHDGKSPATLDQLSASEEEPPIPPSLGIRYENTFTKTGHRLAYTQPNPYPDISGQRPHWLEVFGYDLPTNDEPIRQNPTPAPSP